jgi:hypothetical protein
MQRQGALGFEIWTSRYANRALADFRLVPIGVTLWTPRFRLGYELATNLRSLAPDKAWFRAPDSQFEARYLEKLATVGVSANNSRT